MTVSVNKEHTCGYIRKYAKYTSGAEYQGIVT